MENGKLMKIVQAVNDSRGEPIGIHHSNFAYIALASKSDRAVSGKIHAVGCTIKEKYWSVICTIEEFNQCVKEMSAGYDKKESNMNNKHPHHDLIVEWAKDTSKVVQVKFRTSDWADAETPYWRPHGEYRFKPREFVKGHWYPCLSNGAVSVNMWDGQLMMDESDDKCGVPSETYDDIGESLGEINFGGGE